MNIDSFASTLIATFQNNILPGIASITVTPGMTVAQLTAELEADVQVIVAKKYGAVVAGLLFYVPPVKQQLDKAISFVATKALPVLESNTLTEVETGAAILAAATAPTPAPVFAAPSMLITPLPPSPSPNLP